MFQYRPKKTIKAQVVELADDPNIATIAWCRTSKGLIPVRHDNRISREDFLAMYQVGSVHELPQKEGRPHRRERGL